MLTQSVPYFNESTRASLVTAHSPAVWLDSALPSQHGRRYSLLVPAPLAWIDVEKQKLSLPQAALPAHPLPNPLKTVQDWLEALSQSKRALHWPFCGGLLGYFTYEFFCRRQGFLPRHLDESLPQAWLMLFDSGVVIDHLAQKSHIFSLGLDLEANLAPYPRLHPRLARQRIEAIQNLLRTTPAKTGSNFHVRTLHTRPNQTDYLKRIHVIRDRIARGDCYQVNFSQRLLAEGCFDAADLYTRLRRASPAPQMALLNLGDTQILSASPEVLLEVEGRIARSYPIKGTCKRSRQAAEDRRLAEALQQSEKNRAELLMIVDLVRNDLGSLCKTGSVRVPVRQALQSLAQVHHLFACVEGTLHEGLSPLQALFALAPGGSVTGAPKLKALEIIDELEDSARGIYTGCIGYADFNRRASFNLAIRTAVLHKNRLRYAMGSGIVWDSNPEAEYAECMDKSQGLIEALRLL